MAFLMQYVIFKGRFTIISHFTPHFIRKDYHKAQNELILSFNFTDDIAKVRMTSLGAMSSV